MGGDQDGFLRNLVRRYLPAVPLSPLPQDAIPRIAKNPAALRAISRAIREIPTRHTLGLADARSLQNVPDGSVHLVVTSPP